MSERKTFRVEPGKFYEMTTGEERPASDAPDIWACRRTAEYPEQWLNEHAHLIALGVCPSCGFSIVYNPARKLKPTVQKICMQCAGITPEPFR